MQVRELMSHPVITVRADSPIEDAAQLLVSHGFTGMPVVDDDDRLIGFVTEADVLKGQIGQNPPSHAHKVGRFSRCAPSTVSAVMSTIVESLTPGAETTDAAKIMIDERIRCLPVVDGLRIVGVITRRDLLRAGPADRDADLAAEVVRQLSVLAGPDRWSVSVRAGRADIQDFLDNAEDRSAAERLAVAVPGITFAEAHFLPPGSVLTANIRTFDPGRRAPALASWMGTSIPAIATSNFGEHAQMIAPKGM